MHGIAVLLPRTRVATARRALQGGHYVRVVHVVLAAVHVLQQAADIHVLLRIPGLRAQLARVGIEARETGATDARGGIGEAQVDHLRFQADDLEQLRATVAGHGADAHLRDDLRQALVDALAVAAADLRLLAALAELEDAAAAEVEQGLVGQVRVHRRGAEAEQAGHVVRVARGAGLDDKIHVAAQAQPREVVVDGAGGQQGVHHRPPGHRVAVGQQQHHHAVARGLFGFGTDALDTGTQAFVLAVGQVEQAVGLHVLVHLQQLAQLALAEYRRVEDDVVHRLRAGMEDVGLLAELGGQGHRAVFAPRVDRRVGDLGEGLAEVVVERAAALAQHRHRRVVAHRASGFLFGLGQRPQHLLHFFAAELVQLVVAAQGAFIEGLFHQ
ncbi:hypothetical protein G6F22_012457 [Rhizopus arrhizus]|nr:hypothetical protein G6F22_012457 [Rhizopus arrhizus]